MIVLGSLFIVLPGVFFWDYVQKLVAQGIGASTGTTNAAGALALLNGTENTPWMVTMAFFGLSFFITGGVFFAIGSLGTQLTRSRALISTPAPMVTAAPTSAATMSQQSIPAQAQMARACMKCGTLVASTNSFCPSCGNPMQRVQPMIPATT